MVSLTDDEMEFDMIGIDASIANAFRRILIAEVGELVVTQFSDVCLYKGSHNGHREGLHS